MKKDQDIDAIKANIISNFQKSSMTLLTPELQSKPKTIKDFSSTKMHMNANDFMLQQAHLKKELVKFSEKIELIKKKFAFNSRYDLKMELESLVDLISEKIRENEQVKPTDENKIFRELRDAFIKIQSAKDILEQSLTISLLPVREKLIDALNEQLPTSIELDEIRNKYPIFKRSLSIKKNNSTNLLPLHSIENLLENINPDDLHRLICACSHLASKKTLTRGGRPKNIGIEYALQHLAAIYTQGTHTKPTISWNEYKGKYSSNFFSFVNEINQLLNDIHPSLNLGKNSYIGRVIKEKLSVVRENLQK